MKNRGNYTPIIPGMGFPGQRETRRSDDKSDFHLPLRQWAGVVVLFTLSFLLVIANVLIIGPLVGYLAGVITFGVILLYSYALVWRKEQPIPMLVAITGLSILGFWIIAGYNITERFWWDIRVEWAARNKMLFVVFSCGFVFFTLFVMYRFLQEIIDPNWSPTISIRPAEWGVLWPWKQLPENEQEYDNSEPYSAPRQTAIDEVDERADNGSPKVMRVSWLPISPEETQRLAVAVVCNPPVRFVRGELVKAKAVLLNDYKGVKDALLSRSYLRKSGNGVALTFAGYRWLCKQIPDDMTPLPYTSLDVNGKTNG